MLRALERLVEVFRPTPEEAFLFQPDFFSRLLGMVLLNGQVRWWPPRVPHGHAPRCGAVAMQGGHVRRQRAACSSLEHRTPPADLDRPLLRSGPRPPILWSTARTSRTTTGRLTKRPSCGASLAPGPPTQTGTC